MQFIILSHLSRLVKGFFAFFCIFYYFSESNRKKSRKSKNNEKIGKNLFFFKKALQSQKKCGIIYGYIDEYGYTLSYTPFIFLLSETEVKAMPNIKSAKKRVLVTQTKTLQNKMFKTQLKTDIKKYQAALASGDTALAQETYKVAVKKIDKAAARGIIHKNAAARKKSQFTKALNNI
jgi:small subunit ribosomal protein S20